MKKIIHTFLLLLIAVSLFQCRKDPGYIGEPDPDPSILVTPDPDPITTNLQGNIVDENGLPAAGVSVKAGSQTVITDDKGYFRINHGALDKKNTLVIAQKNGYFKGMRLFAATTGTNYVFIKLIKRTEAGTVDATAGGTVTLTNGGQVSLPANGIKMAASGNDYSGVVHVYAQYIDPAAADIASTVPGSFNAINKDGKTVVLTSYGMMAVELESASGEKLQIKDGSVATLASPIPTAAQAAAPATISLWYVDEENGLWRDEGTASKQGNNYVGEVKHFTFWNCDLGNDAVMLSMKILNGSGQPLVNTAVRITRVATWLTSATGYTDSLGKIAGLLPANEALLLNVLDPCGAIAYTQNIASLTQNTDLGNITVPNTSAGIITITGRLVDCDNQPVTNGYALISFENNYRYASTDANGNYEATFIYCPNSVSSASIVAVNTGTGGAATQTASVVVNLTTPTSNLGDMIVCGTSPDLEYINYNIDGVDYYWTPQNSFQMQGVNFPQDVNLLADNQPGARQFVLNIEGASTGTFMASFQSTDAFPSGGSVNYINMTGTITNYITAWPDYFEGSFSGQYQHSSTGPTIHTINGTFRVQHQF